MIKSWKYISNARETPAVIAVCACRCFFVLLTDSWLAERSQVLPRGLIKPKHSARQSIASGIRSRSFSKYKKSLLNMSIQFKFAYWLWGHNTKCLICQIKGVPLVILIWLDRLIADWAQYGIYRLKAMPIHTNVKYNGKCESTY